ncbi:hypothetical protein PTNB73_03366 [Pyrenophora teres f. teres]|uniref:Uncharacterized protein n=1 Tax=Pyrenophora teres f. teres TaxID=97479 RepID=A0A6S6W3X1_9PLEO|nr:hypothetical protein PTNB85_02847 [Pyrenophora teres f. teres]KAE8866271.1 hypothetical protein PTNB29_03418 [Pyrenophora teres f. teres]KAE8871907.1 hypothetical protein PTNB73_03366 [Pyrenophora teres f. teres]CAA9962465.1 hypothetical protein PTMSG1_05839 [Pyrenophora teres f. maculata]CAE7178525.1 hypothetical protein PTTW11_06371 [Pyrenophora teres f. teres]
MYTTTLLISALVSTLSFVATASPLTPRQAVQVASVDRYTGDGCTGTVCNKAGSGDLYPGCHPVSGCQASLRLNYANLGCKVTVFTDTACSASKGKSAVLTSAGICVALGGPINSYSVTGC